MSLVESSTVIYRKWVIVSVVCSIGKARPSSISNIVFRNCVGYNEAPVSRKCAVRICICDFHKTSRSPSAKNNSLYELSGTTHTFCAIVHQVIVKEKNLVSRSRSKFWSVQWEWEKIQCRARVCDWSVSIRPVCWCAPLPFSRDHDLNEYTRASTFERSSCTLTDCHNFSLLSSTAATHTTQTLLSICVFLYIIPVGIITEILCRINCKWSRAFELHFADALFITRTDLFNLNKFFVGLDNINNPHYQCRGRHPALGHPLPWAIWFIFWEENKYFSSYAYCFIFKSDLLNPNFVEKKIIFYTFFLGNLLFRWAK